MHLFVSLLARSLRAVLESRRTLAHEDLARRKQLAMYSRTQKRPRLRREERAI